MASRVLSRALSIEMHATEEMLRPAPTHQLARSRNSFDENTLSEGLMQAAERMLPAPLGRAVPRHEQTADPVVVEIGRDIQAAASVGEPYVHEREIRLTAACR